MINSNRLGSVQSYINVTIGECGPEFSAAIIENLKFIFYCSFGMPDRW